MPPLASDECGEAERQELLTSAHGLREDSAMELTLFKAHKVESSPPESPCSTALPTEDLTRANASPSGMREASSPNDARDDRKEERGVHCFSSSFEAAKETVKQLQRLRWSPDDFSFLGCLGTGRASTVGASL